MSAARGTLFVTEPGKGNVEIDTFTCSHCNSIQLIQPYVNPSDLGGFCLQCYKNICSGCASTGGCAPFEKKLEEIERKDRFLRSVLG